MRGHVVCTFRWFLYLGSSTQFVSMLLGRVPTQTTLTASHHSWYLVDMRWWSQHSDVVQILSGGLGKVRFPYVVLLLQDACICAIRCSFSRDLGGFQCNGRIHLQSECFSYIDHRTHQTCRDRGPLWSSSCTSRCRMTIHSLYTCLSRKCCSGRTQRQCWFGHCRDHKEHLTFQDMDQ